MSESDFAESIRILEKHRARFLVVGGYAMAHQGLVRATNDVDVLVATDEASARATRAMTQRPWLLHPEVLVELRAAAEWHEERAAGIGEDFAALIQRHLEAGASLA